MVIQSKPHGAKTRISLIAESDLLWQSVPTWLGDKVPQVPLHQALPTFAALAMGEYLDETALPRFSGGEEPIATIELSETLSRVERIHTATYEEIQVYLESKIYWAWQFRKPTTQITHVDLVRLGTSLDAIQQVASLRVGELWTLEPPGRFRPTSRLIDGFTRSHLSSRSDARDRSLVAVLFADVVDSTHLTHQSEDAAIRMVDALQEDAGKLVSEWGGVLIKFMGDGFLATFPNVRTAIRAACTLKERFAATTVAMDLEVQLRVGIHVGEIVRSDSGDIHGDAVNVAARIQSAASPGEVVVSEDVWRQLRHQQGFSFRDLGEHDLKGIPDPVRLYEIL